MEWTNPVFARVTTAPAARAELPAVHRQTPRTLRAEPRIAVVRNPRSHRNKGLDDDCRGASEVLIAAPNTRAELQGALARFAAQQIDILVIDGGDGTVRDVLTRGAPAFGADWPELMILPKGKTNALAVDLGVPRMWSFAEAIQAARSGNIVRRRPLVVECEDSDQRPLWGFILGAGVFNAAIETGQVAHRYGAFQSFAVGVTAVSGMAQALFGFGDGPWRRSAPMRLYREDGAELPHTGEGDPGRRFLALFSSLSRFPLGIMPFRRSDQGIRYLVIDAPRRRALARVPAVLRGIERRDHEPLGIHRGFGEGFRVDLAESGFILDGEAFPAGRLRLRHGPELRFIVP